MAANPSIYTQIPTNVLTIMKKQFNNYQQTPFCFVETSHRSKQYDNLNKNTQNLVKTYYNAQQYQCLLMPSGTAIASLYFNLNQWCQQFLFVVNGQFSEKCYRQMTKYHRNVKKVKNEEMVGVYQRIGKSRKKTVIHYNELENGKIARVPKIPEQIKEYVRVVGNMNYCFPWTEKNKLQCEIAYIQSQTGLSTCGYTILLIKRQILQSLEVKNQIPDMLSFKQMHTKNSIVNTPFTLCTFVLYYHIKYALENRQDTRNKIKENRNIIIRQFEKTLPNSKVIGDPEPGQYQNSENMLVIQVQRMSEELLFGLVKNGIGWQIDQNKICFYIQQSTNSIALIIGKQSSKKSEQGRQQQNTQSFNC